MFPPLERFDKSAGRFGNNCNFCANEKRMNGVENGFLARQLLVFKDFPRNEGIFWV